MAQFASTRNICAWHFLFRKIFLEGKQIFWAIYCPIEDEIADRGLWRFPLDTTFPQTLKEKFQSSSVANNLLSQCLQSKQFKLFN